MNRTCNEHAAIMAALVPPNEMGPTLKALYERFLEGGDEECIAHESQVVHLFAQAVMADQAPATDGTSGTGGG